MIPSSESEARAAIARRLRRQAKSCSQMGSPLYADLLERTAQDVEASGPSWGVLRGHEGDPPGSALALRFVGAVHRLVLEGRAPQLSQYYPSVGGKADEPGIWGPFADLLEREAQTIQLLLERPVQTNEVRRSRALLGGFLQIARETGLPLSLLEVGASAGLNLRWDHFRYEIGEQAWGNPTSPVYLRDGFEGAYPSLDVPVDLVARRGCDARPIDPRKPDGRLTLQSYIWADQVDRIARLEAAIEVAARVPAQVDGADAPEWLAARLGEDVPDVARVVYHSIVLQYLTDTGRDKLLRIIREAGERATRTAPLAWLRMEPAGEHTDVRLTMWPGGEELLLAQAGFHGEIVHWLLN